MPAPLLATVENAIASASGLYHRLIFLVGTNNDSRTAVLFDLSANHNWPLINLGIDFSQRLLDLPRRHRAVSTPQLLADFLGTFKGDVLLLDHIELLFDRELAQDPVRLFQSLSRNRTLVVSWPGAHDEDTLFYAEPGHPEFYKQPIPELLHVPVPGELGAVVAP